MSFKQLTLFGIEEKDTISVIFIQDVSLFVGLDKKLYGPFKKGMKTEIPKLNSIGLLQKGGCIIDKS